MYIVPNTPSSDNKVTLCGVPDGIQLFFSYIRNVTEY